MSNEVEKEIVISQKVQEAIKETLGALHNVEVKPSIKDSKLHINLVRGKKESLITFYIYNGTETLLSIEKHEVTEATQSIFKLGEVLAESHNTNVLVINAPAPFSAQLKQAEFVELDVSYQLYHTYEKAMNLGDALFYKSVVPGYIETVEAYMKTALTTLGKVKERDVTFDFKGSYLSGKFSVAYYYKGVHRGLKITFSKPMEITDSYLEETRTFATSEELTNELIDIFSEIGDSRKFDVLLDPPNKHFKDTVYYQFREREEIIDKTYKLLCNELGAEQVEVMFATKPNEVYTKITVSPGHMFVKITSLYFCLDFTDKAVTMYKSLEEGSTAFRNMVVGNMYQAYLDKSSEFKQKFEDDLKNLK